MEGHFPLSYLQIAQRKYHFTKTSTLSFVCLLSPAHDLPKAWTPVMIALRGKRTRDNQSLRFGGTSADSPLRNKREQH